MIVWALGVAVVVWFVVAILAAVEVGCWRNRVEAMERLLIEADRDTLAEIGLRKAADFALARVTAERGAARALAEGAERRAVNALRERNDFGARLDAIGRILNGGAE